MSNPSIRVKSDLKSIDSLKHFPSSNHAQTLNIRSRSPQLHDWVISFDSTRLVDLCEVCEYRPEKGYTGQNSILNNFFNSHANITKLSGKLLLNALNTMALCLQNDVHIIHVMQSIKC